MSYIGRVGCGTIFLVLFVGLIICGFGIYLGTQSEQTQTNREAIQIQATVEAQKSLVELEREKALAAQAKAQSDLLAYMTIKSEERQDEMLLYIMNGETKQDLEAKAMRYVTFAILGWLGLAVLGAYLMQHLPDTERLKMWIKRNW